MSKHSVIGASSMHRWMNCPGSVRLSQDIESQSSPYAEEGTRAHAAAEHYLLNGKWPKDTPEEMKQHLQCYFDEIDRIRRHPGTEYWVELRLDGSQDIHPGIFGTADFVAYQPDRRILFVRDLKYGAGIPVEVRDNVQLLYYGLLAMYHVSAPVDKVDIGVVQPRCEHPEGPMRFYRYDASELFDFEEMLIEKAKATEDPNAPLATGPWCRFCPAAATCPKLSSQSLTVAQDAFLEADKKAASVTVFDPDHVADVLAKIEVVEGWCKSFREYAYAEASRGNLPTGYKMVAKRATRKWTDKATPKALAKAVGINEASLTKDPELLSPAQVEKILVARKMDTDALAPFYVKESSGLKLVPESEPGVPVATGVEIFDDGASGQDDIFS